MVNIKNLEVLMFYAGGIAGFVIECALLIEWNIIENF